MKAVRIGRREIRKNGPINALDLSFEIYSKEL